MPHIAETLLKYLILLFAATRCSGEIYNYDNALAVRTDLEGRLEFPNGAPFNLTAQIMLNNGEYQTFSRRDGSFIIFDVPPGIHQLDIHSKAFHFGQVKIQLLEESMDAPKCLEYLYPGANKRVIKYPLVLNPKGTYQYFEMKRGFSLLALFKNPMVIMMLFSVGMMVMLPKMMEGLDPEEKARMKEQMKNQQDPQQMLSQMWGEITGGAEEQEKKTISSNSKKRR